MPGVLRRCFLTEDNHSSRHNKNFFLVPVPHNELAKVEGGQERGMVWQDAHHALRPWGDEHIYFSLKQLAILRDDLATHGHVYFILSAFFVASSIGPIR